MSIKHYNSPKIRGIYELRKMGLPILDIKVLNLFKYDNNKLWNEIKKWAIMNNPFAFRTGIMKSNMREIGTPYLINININKDFNLNDLKDIRKNLINWIHKNVINKDYYLILSQYVNKPICNGIAIVNNGNINIEFIPRDLPDLARGKYTPTFKDKLYYNKDNGILYPCLIISGKENANLISLLIKAKNGIYEFGIGDVNGLYGVYFYEYKRRMSNE